MTWKRFLRRLMVFTGAWLIFWVTILCVVATISPQEGNLALPMLGGIIIALALFTWVLGLVLVGSWKSPEKGSRGKDTESS